MPIATYDFSTLHTIVLHNKLKNVVRELLNFCFKGRKKQFIAVTKFGATWTDNENKFKITFDTASLKLSIDFLLGNCFFSFVNLSFWQITGTPMGSDPAPIMENLFYIIMKMSSYNILKKEIYVFTSLSKARLSSNTSRFMVNLFAINDHLEFDKTLRIYILQSCNSKRKAFQLPMHHL